VAGVLGKDAAQMVFAKGRPPVGDFGPDREHEPLRIVHMKKSADSMVAAWECRNRCQVVSVRRWGAGEIRSALRTRRIVDALTR
jgi:hypothetical protein